MGYIYKPFLMRLLALNVFFQQLQTAAATPWVPKRRQLWRWHHDCAPRGSPPLRGESPIRMLQKLSGRFPRGIDRSEMNLLNREG